MRLIPPLKALALADAKPGSLVRARVGGDFLTCLISGVSPAGQGVIIVLEPHQTFPCPCYHVFPINEPATVLSYETNYEFRSPRAARIMQPHAAEFGQSGAMLVGATGAVIRVFPTSGGGTNLYFNISTGLCATGSGDAGQQLALLDWDIQLSSAHDHDPPFFSFSIP